MLDQALFDGEFIQEFNEAEYKLKAVSPNMRILDHIVSLDHIYHWEVSEFLRVNDMCEKCLDEIIIL